MAEEIQRSEPAPRRVRAIILAAGMGRRLGSGYGDLPKCLLEFGGKSLLRRYLEILQHCEIDEIVIATGYRGERVENELAAMGVGPAVEVRYNPHYELGSVLTLWNLREPLCRGGDTLLMDADMLFDYRLIERLLASPHRNCLLVDRNMEPGEEPVKLCIRDGIVVELRKQIDSSQHYDFCGEMMGLVGLSAEGSALLLSSVGAYVRHGDTTHDYEEVLRDLLLSEPGMLGFEDCTGLPWIEIDFPHDVERARNEVLPRLRDSDAGMSPVHRRWRRQAASGQE